MLAPPTTDASGSKHLNSLSGLVPYRGRRKGDVAALTIALAITGIIILIITIYYILNSRPVIGSQLVYLSDNKTPFEIPSPSVSPVYIKPITLLFACGIIFSFCFFSLLEPKIERYLPRFLKVLFLLLSGLLLAMGIYEIFFNFSLWTALMAANPGVSPDLLYNDYPINTVKINLAFATKMVILWSVVALFGFLTFRASLAEGDASTAS
jgi:hypothetical protein